MDTISFYSPNSSGNWGSEVVRDIQHHTASRGQTRVRSWCLGFLFGFLGLGPLRREFENVKSREVPYRFHSLSFFTDSIAAGWKWVRAVSGAGRLVAGPACNIWRALWTSGELEPAHGSREQTVKFQKCSKPIAEPSLA